MPPTLEPEHARRQIVCPACREGLVHRVVVLHAGEDTLVTCGAAWDALPSWLQEAFGQVKKGQPIAKRREVVREIREHLEG